MKTHAAAPTALPDIAVTGRFQPFHDDHLELVRHALARARRVFIAITNPDRRSLQAVAQSRHRHLDSANPFSWLERLQVIDAALTTAGVARERFFIVPFPLEAPDTWTSYVPLGTIQLVRVYSDWEREKVRRLETGGYQVIALEGDPARRLSATDLRAAMATGDGAWQARVPPGARECLEPIVAQVFAARCRADESEDEHGD